MKEVTVMFHLKDPIFGYLCKSINAISSQKGFYAGIHISVVMVVEFHSSACETQ